MSSRVNLSRRAAVGAATTLVAALALAGCGSSSTTTPSSSPASASPGASSNGSQGRGQAGGQNGAALAKIQACLTAAGIAVPSRPSGAPNAGTRPSGAPSTRPSGAAGGRPGGIGSVLNTAAAKAALKACGLSVPSGQPSPAPTSSS
jgi:hypothetical protein